MRALLAFVVLFLVVGACTVSEEEATTTSSTAATPRTPDESVTSEAQVVVEVEVMEPFARPCHPTNEREDCTLVIVALDTPIDLAGAEEFAAEHHAYLHTLYRVDPVCVAKDFPIMGGSDLGETPSRRTYWEAEERMRRIAADRAASLVPPATIGGFDTVINQRMSDEWRFAQMPGVLFDSLGLWIDQRGAQDLALAYRIDVPDHWRYEHAEGRGEIAVDRHYDPPSLATTDEADDCLAVP